MKIGLPLTCSELEKEKKRTGVWLVSQAAAAYPGKCEGVTLGPSDLDWYNFLHLPIAFYTVSSQQFAIATPNFIGFSAISVFVTLQKRI